MIETTCNQSIPGDCGGCLQAVGGFKTPDESAIPVIKAIDITIRGTKENPLT
jgi:hypothetical protein